MTMEIFIRIAYFIRTRLSMDFTMVAAFCSGFLVID